ncbi:MAG: hypothetical protein ISS47_08070 [Candidatus Omnitrophica bacterium]|nr:hypothetical protein [Candidatus Omnitrophota bacterium]
MFTTGPAQDFIKERRKQKKEVLAQLNAFMKDKITLKRPVFFVPVGWKLYEILTRYFTPVDLICISRHNQTSNTPIWHQRAKQYNFYLRGFKYLLIMRKI